MMSFSLETDERSGFIPDRDYDYDYDSDSDYCSSNSSIGRNSVSSKDSSDREEDSADVEVNTNFKSPLETMNDLEQDLPVKLSLFKILRQVIDKSFGFDTAIEDTQRAINAAHAEG
ncbi:hypothetical protein RIF29_21181 [Crotalaria pallida]|uniref:Uncharacterized protein n=1 Tax=Crotalaria pallida TaxID=3830 RepID=A0AAN9F2K8_CROPI